MIDITAPALRPSTVSGKMPADARNQALPAPHPERAQDMRRETGQVLQRILILTRHCLP